MPKILTPAMRAHLDEEATRLAAIWRITRQDGAQFFFTDHDRDILFGGDSYRADAGFERTAIRSDAGFAVDNLDLVGVFAEGGIVEDEVRAGLFDGAEIAVSFVNWQDPDTYGEIRLRRGTLGEVRLTPQGHFTAELRGLSQPLAQSTLQIYGPACRADLGDDRCKFPIKPPLLGRELPTDAYAVHGEAALLAVAYQGQDAIDVWNVAEARRISTVPIRSKAFLMAFSPRGDRVAVVHGQRAEGAGRYDPLDYSLEIRRIPGGDRIAEIPLGQLEPRFISFLPDGKRLFFATGDWQFPNDIHVVGLSDEDSILTLEDVREIHALRIAPDGEHLALSDGHRVRVWNVTTGRAVAQLPTTAFINSIGFLPDGHYLATASDNDDLTL